jgi:hypothetical protein
MPACQASRWSLMRFSQMDFQHWILLAAAAVVNLASLARQEYTFALIAYFVAWFYFLVSPSLGVLVSSGCQSPSTCCYVYSGGWVGCAG